MDSHPNAHLQLPPGTSQLVTGIVSTGALHKYTDIFLERVATGDDTLQLFPQPSADPNEPLNWSKARKFVNYSLVLILTLAIFTG